MKLSTRARYGIHAMYDLAQNYGAQPRPIKSVAEAQGIPEAYLEQLLCTLRRARPGGKRPGRAGRVHAFTPARGNYRRRGFARAGRRAEPAGVPERRGRLRQKLRLVRPARSGSACATA